MNERALLQLARSCIDSRGMSSPEYDSLCKCTLAMIDEALAVPEQEREEWIAEMDGLADAVEDLAGIVAHELSTADDLEKLCAARNKLHARIRTVPAPSGYEATIATQAAEIERLRAYIQEAADHAEDVAKSYAANSPTPDYHEYSYFSEIASKHLAALSPQKERES